MTDVRTLIEKVREYLTHHGDCEWWSLVCTGHIQGASQRGSCTCGLEALLQHLTGTQEPEPVARMDTTGDSVSSRTAATDEA